MNIEIKTPETVEVKFDEIYENVVAVKDYARMCTEMRLRVCAYARVSTDSEEQKTSYDSQLTYYENLIQSNPNWEFIEVYADEGISGTQLKKRDNFNRMIQDALNGKIDMIIAKSISRFARNTVDTLNIVRLLRSHNVDIFFEKENIHTLSMSNELFLALYSAFAQAESESISENMKAGLRYKMKRGEFVGQAQCYGLNWNKIEKEVEIDYNNSKIVLRIFNEYAVGLGTTLISNGLNDDGIPSPKGGKWTAETVRRILLNEKYKGDLCTGKSYVVDVLTHKKVKNRGQSKQYYTKNHHKAIVPIELWNKVQEIYQKRSGEKAKSRDKYSRRYTFSSKIHCGCCGQRFVRKSYLKNKKDPNSERVVFWGCRSRNYDSECTNRMNYRDEELKAMFVVSYNQLFKNRDKYMEKFLIKIDEAFNEDNLMKEKMTLESEKNKLMKKQSDLVDLLLSENNKIPKDILEQKMLELSNNLDLINQRLQKIEDNENVYKNKNSKIEKIIEQLNKKEKLDEFDDSVFESIVERVIIGEKLEDGTFDYETVKFILKTGEVITSGSGMKMLDFTLYGNEQKNNEYGKTLHVTLEKVDEDKNNYLTAYVQHKRSNVCRRNKR